MRAFNGFKVWAAVLLLAVALWAQSGQISNMGDLKAQIDAFNKGNSDMTITIGVDSINISSPLEINNYGYTLTVQSLTSTPRMLIRAVGGNLFTITKGSLTLQNITIDGNKTNQTYAKVHGSLVYVGDGGILNMLGGTTLQNNVSDDNGSGVYVDSRGKFNMSGGTITGNKTDGSGGGVFIYGLRATFNMSGGIITNNTCGTSAASYSGGVHFAKIPPPNTDTDPDKTPSIFRLGGTAVIKDNAKGNGSLSNVYMAGDRYITLGDGTDGVPAPTGGMEVWITKVAEKGLFVNTGAKPPNPPSDPFGDTKYFQADAGSQVYYKETGKLIMETGYDISLDPDNLKFMKIYGYDVPTDTIKVTNIGGRIGKLIIRLSGEHANNFVLDTTGISNDGMEQSETQTFTIKPISGLDPGTYNAFVVVSAPEKIDGGPVIMRRLDIEFLVREYVEERTLYFNQSDGKFYASSAYTEIDSLPSPSIFVPDNEISIPASWNSETNTLKLSNVDWKTTAPYALYFCQPTPVTLELVGNNSFVSTSVKTNSAGIVSRNSLTIIGDSLEAQGGDYGLFSYALTINSGTFIASGTKAMEIKNANVILRVPDSPWWYKDTDGTEKPGPVAFTYSGSSYNWIKINVLPPDYELGASVNNSEPFVREDVEITLTVKDITKGDIYPINITYAVDLTGISTDDFVPTSDFNSVQFKNGIGKINMNFKKPGAQILHFSIVNPNYPAINPIVITPLLPTVSPDISIHIDSLTIDTTTHGYPAQPPVNIVIENKNPDGHPTGDLTVKVTGKDSASFTVSTDKVPSIAANGSNVIKITPLPDLDAKTHNATVVISGDRIAEDKKIEVSFTVAKAPGAKVATPILANETAKSVFIYSIPKPSTGQEVEYAISATSDTTSLKANDFVTFGSNLSTLEFSSLPKTTSYTYYIFARSKENTNYEAGTISEPMQSCIPFNEIAVALWGNNTLTVINNRDNNIVGTDFLKFTWFRDGQDGQEIVGDKQSLSEYENGASLQPGKYHVEMENSYTKLTSCKYEILGPPPITETTSASFRNVEATDVYSISGKRLTRLNAQDLILKSKTGSKTVKVGEVTK